ncbi:hypothetical protein [Burkholderia stagnalis]|uniref:hypothetical protein n=1 Tax=Burkholderia stagnalis TaxID=1503054 RepID=UPI001F49EBCF|nr:hypothetical protein [Burkholderia stagnalis]
MANNNFKAFAAAGGANVMTQADYEALAALLTGFVSGTAQSAQLNKVWRQSSIMSAVLAQFIVDLTGQDAIDDGTTATLLANLKTGVKKSGAIILLQTAVVTSPVASIDFTGLSDSYKQYIVEIDDLTASAAGGELRMLYSSGGAFITTASYAYAWMYSSTTSANPTTGGSSNGANFTQLMNGFSTAAGLGVSGRIDIYGPRDTAPFKRSKWDTILSNGTSTVRVCGAGSGPQANIDGIRLLISNANISTATVKLYGVN